MFVQARIQPVFFVRLKFMIVITAAPTIVSILKPFPQFILLGFECVLL